jgi:hypothetical protein
MAGLSPQVVYPTCGVIHVLRLGQEDVDARDKAGMTDGQSDRHVL